MLVPYLDDALSKASAQTNKNKILIETVDPGFCHSELGRSFKGLAGLAFRLYKFFMARATAEGSKTLVYTAVADKVEQAGSAKHWASCEEAAKAVILDTEEGQAWSKQLWFETIKILQDADPRVKEILG